MLTVIYDPIEGDAYPDGKTKEVVYAIVEKANQEDLTVTVSTELFIQRVRVAINKGIIDHTKVIIKFKDTILQPDKKGKLSQWPEGFCDYYEECLINLF
jgi:hypothetical protein